MKLKRNCRFHFCYVDDTQVYFSHKLMVLLYLPWYSYQPFVQCVLSVKSCFGIQLAMKGLRHLVRSSFGRHVYRVTANDVSTFRNLFHGNLMA